MAGGLSRMPASRWSPDVDRAAFVRRNRDLDPQLVWRGKDEQDWSDLVVPVPPIFPQESISPGSLIAGLLKDGAGAAIGYYGHAGRGPNRMILGDSLVVMASLAEREGLRGQVQCVYVDPPYGIRFQSNFQWSTTSRDVKDGDAGHITREPEQVRAFRDTWRDGIHSYLTYLRDRLVVARELLADSGSVFFQIGEENAHLARSLLDEVFGPQNFVADIVFRKKTMPLGARFLDCMVDHILWFAKDADQVKYRQLYWRQDVQGDFHWKWFETPAGTFAMSREQLRDHTRLPEGARIFRVVSMKAPGYSAANDFPIEVDGRSYRPPRGGSWITGPDGMRRLCAAGRVFVEGRTPTYKLYLDDFPLAKLTSLWSDTVGAFGKRYVVETNEEIVKRCLLMATDPGDLVLDPTCGSGTTATVAEEWGRRWITMDTSRVALALARTRVMGARYPWYRLADGRDPAGGFNYARVPHVTLKAVANCSEIDEICTRHAARAGGGDLGERLREIAEAIARTADAEWLHDKPEVESKR
ncbi:MAG: site-specific DNA-methyltransferase, partial [Candidatus Sericytochromatia bacterium]|nr:site-specific DNA-methyltransferase [Candidatus Tanganyikabacteria bacterium]